jgi:nucleoside phosphorylase
MIMHFECGNSLTTGQIVDKDSAVLRLPNEIAVGVAQSNHKMVCKFDRRDSQKYRPVWMAIRTLAESALAVGATSVSVASPHTDTLGATSESRYRINEHDKYTVGWICALPIEMAVAVGMLDERHESLPQDKHDHNNYTLGRVGQHNVAIACLPAGVTGVTSAARVASQMLSTFSALRFGLMVGIGGGVPSEENDIRLGDVVVSQPTGTSGGVIQYDFGKTVQEGRFERTGSLNRPPDLLLNAVASLKARHMVDEPVLSRYVAEMGSKYSRLRMTSTHPGVETDQLFEAEYDHPVGEASCANCDISRVVRRDDRMDHSPVIHYGLVASGNQVMRDGRTRERLRREMNVLCFEMEAAGLMDNFPCLVVRGICDYADSHKNKRWQPYAASTAAGYAKELLNIISGSQVVGTRTVGEMTPAMLN